MSWISTLARGARGTFLLLSAVAFLATAALVAGAALIVRGNAIRAEVPREARFYLVARSALADLARKQLGEIAGLRVGQERRLAELLPTPGGQESQPDRLRVLELGVEWPLAEQQLAARLDRVRRTDGLVDLIDLNARQRREATGERAMRHIGLGIVFLVLGAAVFVAAVVGAAQVAGRSCREEIAARVLLGADAARLWRPLASLVASSALFGSLLACLVVVIAAHVLPAAPAVTPTLSTVADHSLAVAAALMAMGTTGLALLAARRAVQRASRISAFLGLLALAPLLIVGSSFAAEVPDSIPGELELLRSVARELAVCRRALHVATRSLASSQQQSLLVLAERDRVLVRLAAAQRAQSVLDVQRWQAICAWLGAERARLRRALRVSRELGPPIQPRTRPVSGPVRVSFGMAGHRPGTAEFRNGVALGTRAGETVRATARGKVAFAGALARSGPVVVIDHGARTYSVYAKIAETLVVRGMEVDSGEPIGRAGTEPLYFSVRRRGHALDPLEWIGRS